MAGICLSNVPFSLYPGTEPYRLKSADIAQLGERQTEDLKVPGSIPGVGILLFLAYN